MQLSMKITSEEIAEIQSRYRYLVNYDDRGPSAQIDPMTYVDSNGDYLIHIAASGGDLRTIQILINAGQDVDVRGDMGCTALHYACAAGHTEIERFLLKHGASLGARNDFGKLPGE